MYRCEICLEVSKPKQPMLRHVVTRDRPTTVWNSKPGTETAREIAVCPKCLAELSGWFGQPKHGPLSLRDLITAHTLTRVARKEKERQRRSKRKQAERERLKMYRPPLFRQAQQPKAPPKPEKVVTVLQQPVVVTPARKLGRSVRSKKTQSAE